MLCCLLVPDFGSTDISRAATIEFECRKCSDLLNAAILISPTTVSVDQNSKQPQLASLCHNNNEIIMLSCLNIKAHDAVSLNGNYKLNTVPISPPIVASVEHNAMHPHTMSGLISSHLSLPLR